MVSLSESWQVVVGLLGLCAGMEALRRKMPLWFEKKFLTEFLVLCRPTVEEV